MAQRIFRELGPVRARQVVIGLLQSAAAGLLAASVVGIGLGVWRLTSANAAPWTLAAILAAGPVLGMLVGWMRRKGWAGAAGAVDRHYGLKDRAKTALAFLSRKEATPWHELQIADAAEHLASIDAKAVAPFRISKIFPASAAALAIALALAIIPLGGKKAQAGPTPPRPEILEIHEQLVEDLKQLDEMAKQEKDEKLDAMLKELKQKVEELKQPGVDVKEALAKLSEMQAAIANQQAQYNTGLVDGQLQSLGDAMGVAQSLEAAGSALQDAKFDQAAKELEKLENPEFDKKEAKALEEKLKQVAKAMGEAGLGQMGEATAEIADGIQGGNGLFQKGARTMAGIARTHARRSNINRLLSAQCDSLNECKSQCNGGEKKQTNKKSNSASKNWGRGVAGNTEGEKTNLASKREIKEVTGTPSDEGDSEMETTHSPEGRQQSARSYKEAYKKALKQSEAVLEGEPIPLGHRQTIRKYFELIRPQNDDTPSDKSETPSGK